ncbi:MAG: Ppx/GppA family phosphatase [Proteobacteria bacterium]|nr:Ppx/GppA family phosphatase [Pseudomonadota bacterium]
MDDVARLAGGPSSAPDSGRHGRPPRGRRSPYWRRRRDHDAECSGPIYAALDLGTNNCRLLVARPAGDSFRVIDAFSRIIRLGEGVSRSGRIAEAAITRAVAALSVCRDKMATCQVTRARLIATEACRIAQNGADFRQRISAEVGIDLEVVDRETEALLAATGCTPLIDPSAAGVILFDIGGGSSEIVRLDRRDGAGRGPPTPAIRGWASLPVGVVTLAERFGGVSVDRAQFESMVAYVGDFVCGFAQAHGQNLEGMHLLGTSGTVTTIAGVHLDLPRYDRQRVDGCWMSDSEVTIAIDRLIATSYDERVANPCIGAERADLVLAGCAILEAIRRYFPFARLRVADRGLREGMLVTMMREDGVWGSAAPA